MRTHAPISWSALALVLILFNPGLSGQTETAVERITLRGANGNEIEAIGVLEARPHGAIIKLSPDAPPQLVPWDKFDLAALQENNPTIYYGYLDARQFDEPILLKLGVYENILSFEEAIARLHQEMEKPRFYTLPDNVNYLFENDPDVLRWKARDFNRYVKIMRDNREDLEAFLRQIFPKDAVLIDDQGNLHHKERTDSMDSGMGETSLRIIVETLVDPRRMPSRRGLDYLREVSLLREDLQQAWTGVRTEIPNHSFRANNPNHMKLPALIDESQRSLDEMLDSSHLHRGNQYKLGEYYNFVYGLAESYQNDETNAWLP